MYSRASGRRPTLRHRRSQKPAYKKIQDAILKRMEAGELSVGATVGSERKLAKLHGVSLMTARHALVALQYDGLVERRRGVGTFVAPPKIQFNKLTSFTENMAGRGLPTESRLLSIKMVDKEHDIAARLGLLAGQQLIRMERLRSAAHEPLALEICYVPAEEFSTLLSANLERESLFSFLEKRHGIALSHADEEVDATAADADIARHLQIPHGHPVLRIRQVLYSTTGHAIAYVLGFYRSDRHTLKIRRFR